MCPDARRCPNCFDCPQCERPLILKSVSHELYLACACQFDSRTVQASSQFTNPDPRRTFGIYFAADSHRQASWRKFHENFFRQALKTGRRSVHLPTLSRDRGNSDGVAYAALLIFRVGEISARYERLGGTHPPAGSQPPHWFPRQYVLNELRVTSQGTNSPCALKEDGIALSRMFSLFAQTRRPHRSRLQDQSEYRVSIARPF